MATHDYIIANQSGAAFRTDLNNALAAIVSNNSNGSSPSTTYAYQWWADTSAGILKLRNSANNAWIDMLNLDGTFVFDLEDGSASAPSLRFADDVNTGIFSGGADEFNIATGGVERMAIDSSGNVGIGTTSPRQKLDVTGNIFASNGAQIQITGTASSKGLQLIGQDDGTSLIGTMGSSGEHLLFRTASNERMRIDTSGRVMIGTTTQFGDGNDKLLIENGTTGGFVGFGSSATFSECIIGSIHAYWHDNKKVAAINFFGGSDTTNRDDGTIRFATSSANNLAEKARISSDGFFQVGTTDSIIFNHSSGDQTGTVLDGNGGIQVARLNDQCGILNRMGTDGVVLSFHNDGACVGFISVASSTTAYSTNCSDRDLKKNFEDWTEDALSLFKDLKPQKFNFTFEEDTVDKTKGYIAQDLVANFPEAYPKNDDGKYVFNPSGMVVYLMKAIQQLEAKVAVLEAA